jgi:hypothetical protein
MSVQAKKYKMSGTRNADGRKILVENPEAKRLVGRIKRRLNNMILSWSAVCESENFTILLFSSDL